MEDGWWSPEDTFVYYKRNLQRLIKLIGEARFDSILRPGQHSLKHANNIEKILKFADVHFEPLLNTTANR